MTDTYSDGNQGQYVDRVVETIAAVRIDATPVVLLLDPCNGVADGNGNNENRDKRIGSKAVARLWSSLQTGDSLLVFQWSDRRKDPRDMYFRPRRIIQEALSKDVSKELNTLPFAQHFKCVDGNSFAMLEVPK